MPEYIEREAVMKYPIRFDNYDKKNGNLDFVCGIESVIEYVEALPTADVVEVRHGEWINGVTGYTCSVCDKQEPTNRFLYCPNCGAKMDKRKDIE